nr:CcdB family protein [Xanthomonas cannabis]
MEGLHRRARRLRRRVLHPVTDQFDIYANVGRNKNIPYVVVVQSKIFDASPRRVVVPLAIASAHSPTPSRFTPEFVVAGQRVVLQPLEMTSVPLSVLTHPAGSLRDEGQRIVDALDELFTRSFG